MRAADLRDVPVIINNRNRVTSLEQLVVWLERAGMRRIFLLDNDSGYPPLLEYYSRSPHQVIYLPQNVGYLALWETEVWHEFADDYFIYTDSDVVPDEGCPADFIERFSDILQRHENVEKVGFGLKIDDLPGSYAPKAEVIARESTFWAHEIEPGVFDADIDTTLALYRPFARGGYWAKAYRTGFPYVAKHLPWYVDSSNLSEEDEYYRTHANADSYWSARN